MNRKCGKLKLIYFLPVKCVLCVCVSVCVLHAHECVGTHVYLEARRENARLSSITLHFMSFQTGSPSQPEAHSSG